MCFRIAVSGVIKKLCERICVAYTVACVLYQ